MEPRARESFVENVISREPCPYTILGRTGTTSATSRLTWSWSWSWTLTATATWSWSASVDERAEQPRLPPPIRLSKML
jgi:hypothetical protein